MAGEGERVAGELQPKHLSGSRLAAVGRREEDLAFVVPDAFAAPDDGRARLLRPIAQRVAAKAVPPRAIPGRHRVGDVDPADAHPPILAHALGCVIFIGSLDLHGLELPGEGARGIVRHEAVEAAVSLVLRQVGHVGARIDRDGFVAEATVAMDGLCLHERRSLDGAGEHVAMALLHGLLTAEPAPGAGPARAVAQGACEHHVSRAHRQGLGIEHEATHASLCAWIMGEMTRSGTIEGPLTRIPLDLVVSHQDPGAVRAGEASHAIRQRGGAPTIAQAITASADHLVGEAGGQIEEVVRVGDEERLRGFSRTKDVREGSPHGDSGGAGPEKRAALHGAGVAPKRDVGNVGMVERAAGPPQAAWSRTRSRPRAGAWDDRREARLPRGRCSPFGSLPILATPFGGTPKPTERKEQRMDFTVPALPYAKDALSPAMGAETL